MKKICKICQTKFIDYLYLGNHPCADTFLKNKQKAKRLKRYPLKVGFCKCSHLTSIYPIPKHERYEKYDYSYTSDNSVVSRSHFKLIAKKICREFKIKKKSFIVEAGSNDGTFLSEVKKISSPLVLGVDPSRNITNLARKKNINTLTSYFNFKNAKKIRFKYGEADILYGANVFNHVDDNIDFLKGAYKLLKKKGILILEVPDFKSLVDKVGFDTIYHEHRHYYSEKSINKIFKKQNFKIIKIDRIKYMAGSIRVYAKKKTNKIKPFIKSKSLSSVKIRDFKKFKSNIFKVINNVKEFVDFYSVKNKKKIYGIGGATKGNTLLNCCGFDDRNIDYILEKSKYKIGKYTPGSGIKIIDEKKIKNIDIALILPWNITNHLINKLSKKNKLVYTSIQKVIKNINAKKTKI